MNPEVALPQKKSPAEYRRAAKVRKAMGATGRSYREGGTVYDAFAGHRNRAGDNGQSRAQIGRI